MEPLTERYIRLNEKLSVIWRKKRAQSSNLRNERTWETPLISFYSFIWSQVIDYHTQLSSWCELYVETLLRHCEGFGIPKSKRLPETGSSCGRFSNFLPFFIPLFSFLIFSETIEQSLCLKMFICRKIGEKRPVQISNSTKFCNNNNFSIFILFTQSSSIVKIGRSGNREIYGMSFWENVHLRF